MLGGLGVVLPTYLNVWQSLEAADVQKERLRFDRVENSYKLIEGFDVPSLLDARSFTRELAERHEEIAPSELVNRLKSDKVLQQSVLLVFNYWENVRISIKSDRADPDILRASLRDVFIETYERFLPWIKSRPMCFQTDIKQLYDLWRE